MLTALKKYGALVAGQRRVLFDSSRQMIDLAGRLPFDHLNTVGITGSG